MHWDIPDDFTQKIFGVTFIPLCNVECPSKNCNSSTCLCAHKLLHPDYLYKMSSSQRVTRSTADPKGTNTTLAGSSEAATTNDAAAIPAAATNSHRHGPKAAPLAHAATQGLEPAGAANGAHDKKRATQRTIAPKKATTRKATKKGKPKARGKPSDPQIALILVFLKFNCTSIFSNIFLGIRTQCYGAQFGW